MAGERSALAVFFLLGGRWGGGGGGRRVGGGLFQHVCRPPKREERQAYCMHAWYLCVYLVIRKLIHMCGREEWNYLLWAVHAITTVFGNGR